MSEAAHTVIEWSPRLRLHPTALIAPGAVVVGEVTMGRDSSLWFQAVLRGDIAPIEVGEGTNVQDGAVVHVDEGFPARIGARVTVGHRAVVHGCVVEDDCMVGMGAIVLTGARVGAGSLVAAGALVREGEIVPPGSVVRGVPAKVAGPVSDEHRASIRRGGEHYVALARTYLARGFSGPHPPGSYATGTSRARGPMSFLEWGALLAVLGESPDWVADRLERNDEALWRRRPAPERWSALEVLCHLRDTERDVWAPRLDRMLRERMPEIPNANMAGWETSRRYNEQAPARALEEWVEARRTLLARLAPLSRADWVRTGIHATHGPYPLAEMVRTIGDHDLSHRRQIAEALGEFA